MGNFYLDTSIWRDYYENRTDGIRPLGDWAFELLKYLIENDYTILYSDLVIDELKKEYTEDEISNIFDIVSDILLKVDIKESDNQQALILSKKYKIPFGDALHAVLSVKNNAILISRDKHFSELQYFVKVMKPEDLI